MALSITVNGGGTFSASMEEGPVSFTATLGAVPGPKGDTGATGPTGVIAATAPIQYNAGTQTVSFDTTWNPFDQSLNTTDSPQFEMVTAGVGGFSFGAIGGLTQTQLTLSSGGAGMIITDGSITFPDATVQTTAFVGEARKVYVTARNNTGSTIGAGKVVYLSGATGNKPTIALAQANAEATSARVIGLTVESIANNADGKVIISGAAENIDTSAFSAGDTLYLSATTAGAMTTTLPAAPLHGVVIGIVTRANPSVGSIEVAIQNYQELAELSDVNVSDKANNDGLFWEASSSTWRSKTIAEVLGYTPSSLALTSFSASAPIAYNSGTGAFTFDSSGFLLKADNLSGLASAATARTNLGLGTMATETAANYAPLASPAFTGNPTAPTPATSDNDTSIATTAFVNAYAPAASTTTAGKVELATDAEVYAGTSTTLAVTPASLVFSEQAPDVFRPRPSDWTQTVSGGSTAVSPVNVYLNTAATTSGNYALRYFVATLAPYSKGQRIARVDWTRPVWISCRFSESVANPLDANARCRFTFGKSATDNAGDMSRRGFGFVVSGGGNFQALAHNGTSQTTGTNGTVAIANTAKDIVVYSDGAGNVKVYADGSEVASCTGGPSSGTSDSPVIQLEVNNASTATAASIVSASNLAFRLL